MLGTTATMDRQLLMELAGRRGDLQFVSIGPEDHQWQEAAAQLGLKNVHFLGPKQYEQLPGYLKHCDEESEVWRQQYDRQEQEKKKGHLSVTTWASTSRSKALR